MTFRMKRRSLLAAAAGLGFTLSLATQGVAADTVTLTFLIDNGDQNIKNSQALADAFTAANPNTKSKLKHVQAAAKVITSSRPDWPLAK